MPDQVVVAGVGKESKAGIYFPNYCIGVDNPPGPVEHHDAPAKLLGCFEKRRQMVWIRHMVNCQKFESNYTFGFLHPHLSFDIQKRCIPASWAELANRMMPREY